ncbi:response regulator [Amycolatopsis magusensis]|uniref:DNA-binding NarL/FixJ family response regulator n=1 Tax=Amycolatopsis magusensis TaxID=882444 RepID=A0ABS4PZA0_9PSEU|nr:response regulator transcription factor [Amycolatopsis magusensis]MBP2184235.1 DNA-binding NarL/FixJ family response regulator [Amycolatopsis magusensis]MDI5982456.1 response regulator transcription factor [Amycolatopsis magusensis]
MTARLRVLVADDHPVVREGLRGMLGLDGAIEVVGEATNGREAIAAAVALRPDVVLMDLRMPDIDGATATASIARQAPGVKVLILTTYDSDHDIVRAVESGATGFLLKDTPRKELTAAVHAAARGETVLTPVMMNKIVNHLRSPQAETLTTREVQVLRFVARGLSNAEIGRELTIGEATVKSHLLKIFTKLGVSDRTAAVMTAMARGILPPVR